MSLQTAEAVRLSNRSTLSVSEHFGLLNLDTPAGRTSRWVVDRVQRLVRPAKAGHAGTLDPLASGVLVVCVGPATRLIDYVQQMPKKYRGEFLLGRTSDTEDIEGDVVELVDPPIPASDAIVAAASGLIGEVMQRPPAFSALKVDGKRAYALARKGQPVELAPRPVTIERVEIVDYDYPRLTLDIVCGSGVYVRSLGRDLAESLGSGAVMSALRRTAIGPFNEREAIDVDTITRDNLLAHLLPPQTAIAGLSQVTLRGEQVEHIAHGRFLSSSEFQTPADPDTAKGCELVALDESGRLIATLEFRPPDCWKPSRVFLTR